MTADPIILAVPKGRILEEAQDKEIIQALVAPLPAPLRSRQPRGVKSELRISHRMVREAMGLSMSEWAREMERIRDFTRAWLARA